MTLPLVTKDSRANLIRAFKASGCTVCKRRYPELDWDELHIDHIDPTMRPNSPGAANRLSRLGVAGIIAELLTCQVLCFDCHKKKTRADAGGVPIENQLALFNGSGGWRY